MLYDYLKPTWSDCHDFSSLKRELLLIDNFLRICNILYEKIIQRRFRLRENVKKPFVAKIASFYI